MMLKKKVKREVLSILDLPVDCIFEISNFFACPFEINSIIRVSRYFYTLFNNNRTLCCENLWFTIGDRVLDVFPLEEKPVYFPFVKKVGVGDGEAQIGLWEMEDKGLEKCRKMWSIVGCFPNTRVVDTFSYPAPIDHEGIIKRNIACHVQEMINGISKLPNLKSVSISNHLALIDAQQLLEKSLGMENDESIDSFSMTCPSVEMVQLERYLEPFSGPKFCIFRYLFPNLKILSIGEKVVGGALFSVFLSGDDVLSASGRQQSERKHRCFQKSIELPDEFPSYCLRFNRHRRDKMSGFLFKEKSYENILKFLSVQESLRICICGKECSFDDLVFEKTFRSNIFNRGSELDSEGFFAVHVRCKNGCSNCKKCGKKMPSHEEKIRQDEHKCSNCGFVESVSICPQCMISCVCDLKKWCPKCFNQKDSIKRCPGCRKLMHFICEYRTSSICKVLLCCDPKCKSERRKFLEMDGLVSCKECHEMMELLFDSCGDE